jgi:hypothetical protein
MTPTQQIAFLKFIHKLIFDSKERGTDISQLKIRHPNIATADHCVNGRWFSDGKLRGFDINMMVNGKLRPLRILEQNPNKTDEFNNLKPNAQLAQQGHQIAWVIRRDTNKFIGKIHGKDWVPSVERAVQTVKTPGATRGTVYVHQQNDDIFNAQIQSMSEEMDWENIPDCAPEDVCNFVGGGEWEYP